MFFDPLRANMLIEIVARVDRVVERELRVARLYAGRDVGVADARRRVDVHAADADAAVAAAAAIVATRDGADKRDHERAKSRRRSTAREHGAFENATRGYKRRAQPLARYSKQQSTVKRESRRQQQQPQRRRRRRRLATAIVVCHSEFTLARLDEEDALQRRRRWRRRRQRALIVVAAQKAAREQKGARFARQFGGAHSSLRRKRARAIREIERPVS